MAEHVAAAAKKPLPAVFRKQPASSQERSLHTIPSTNAGDNRRPIDASEDLGIVATAAAAADAEDWDEDLPVEEEEEPTVVVSRGRSGRRSSSPPRGKRSGSPEAADRAFDDDLADLVLQDDAEAEPGWSAELEGFERRSEATGLYSDGAQQPTFPKDVSVKLVDLAATTSSSSSSSSSKKQQQAAEANTGAVFKACECNMDQFSQVLAAMVAPEEFDREVKANPPIGSWHLYVSKYAFIDGEDTAEFRFDVIPGDGLSTAGTTSTFSEKSIEVRCDLLDHKAGPRSWTFSLATAHPIAPSACRVKVYPKKSKVKVIVKKQTPAYWHTPGTLHAPVTKDNYRARP